MSVLTRPVDIMCDGCQEWARVTAASGSVAIARRELRRRGWRTSIDGSGARLDACPVCTRDARAKAKVEGAAKERERAARRLATIEAEGPEL